MKIRSVLKISVGIALLSASLVGQADTFYPAGSTTAFGVDRGAAYGDLNEEGQAAQAQAIAALSAQVEKSPEPQEVHLSLRDRIIFSKILVAGFWKVLGFGGKQLLHKNSHGAGNSLKDLSLEKNTSLEKNILEFVRDLVEQGQLEGFLQKKFKLLSHVPLLGKKFKLAPEAETTMIQFIQSQLEDAVRTRGLTKDSSSVRYRDWVDVNADWHQRVQDGVKSPVEIYASSDFDIAEPLINGEASFMKRDDLISHAQKSIDIMVWAIYDDVTGQWLYDHLSQALARNPNLKIRIIVDGQVAARPGYHAIEDKISHDLGIPLIKWLNPVAGFAGMHRKIMIVDGQHVISGGMNFGDEYSHLNPAQNKWRDTDIYLHGNVAAVSQKFFNEFWDQSVRNMNLQLSLSPNFQAVATAAQPQNSVQLINQDPVKYSEGSPIFASVMNDILSAKTRIDIENAYIITIPAFTEALQKAKAQNPNLKIRIFTNSIQSVDEPSIGAAMEMTARNLFNAGFEVYMRKGTTVHSKFLIIDNDISYVMSYNFHPRSEKMEGEVAYRFKSIDVATKLEAAFEKDISDPETSFKVTDAATLNVDHTPQLWILLRLMYDQL